jgi:hypothetical protein
LSDRTLSGLTKKQVFVDRNLSAILGVPEGELVSYADIQKRLHKYIKDNDLKNPARTNVSLAPLTSTQSTVTAPLKRCVDCGSEIPAGASYCDLCGVAQ